MFLSKNAAIQCLEISCRCSFCPIKYTHDITAYIKFHDKMSLSFQQKNYNTRKFQTKCDVVRLIVVGAAQLSFKQVKYNQISELSKTEFWVFLVHHCFEKPQVNPNRVPCDKLFLYSITPKTISIQYVLTKNIYP